MRTINYYTSKALPDALYAVCLAFIMLFLSCSKDSDENGYFELKDGPSTIESSALGTSETFTFKASGNWKVEPLSKEKWIKIEPAEGNGDGTFTVTVTKNYTQEVRTSTLFFSVDGHLQNTVLKIEQAAAASGGEQTDPHLYLEDAPTNLDIAKDNFSARYMLRASGSWKIQTEDIADWVTISPMEGAGDSPITLTISKNVDPNRSTSLLFFLNDVQQPLSLPINQAGITPQVSGDIVFSEDFNWLNYGSRIFNATTGETRMGSWTATELAKGWTGTIPPAGIGSTYVSTYARPGFVKLGRTNYGADIISPKLEEVQGTKNLVVTFKAVRYAAGDHYLLTVGVNGPGTVDVSTFNIMNIASPNNTEAGCEAAWLDPEAVYSFVINGATAETQVWFMGGDFDQRSDPASGWPKTVNRIFLDDIIVKVE